MHRGKIFQLVYASKSIRKHDQKSLNKMVCGFREKNRDLDITGLLLYDDFGLFVQLIEGDETKIRGLYENIEQDKRHAHVTVLHEQCTNERLFPDWRMGLQYFGSSLAELKDGTEDNPDIITGDFLRENQALFLELLWCFRTKS